MICVCLDKIIMTMTVNLTLKLMVTMTILRKEPARRRSLLWALDLGLVLYECIPPIPPSGTPIIGSNTLGSCPWMALSSLKDRQYTYSSKWNNPGTLILVRKPELDAPSLQSMEVWVDNTNNTNHTVPYTYSNIYYNYEQNNTWFNTIFIWIT